MFKRIIYCNVPYVMITSLYRYTNRTSSSSWLYTRNREYACVRICMRIEEKYLIVLPSSRERAKRLLLSRGKNRTNFGLDREDDFDVAREPRDDSKAFRSEPSRSFIDWGYGRRWESREFFDVTTWERWSADVFVRFADEDVVERVVVVVTCA